MKLLYRILRAIVGGDIAHDAADSGNPVKIGFKAESTTPAAVADGDRSDWAGTLYGAGFVNPVTSAGAQVTGATDAAAPAAAVFLGGTDGTNLRGLRVGYGGAGNPAAGMLNVMPVVRRASDGTISTLGAAISAADADTGVDFGSVHPRLWNDASFDRQRGNTQGTLLASAARTVLAQSTATTNYNARAVVLFLDVTASPGLARTLRIGVDIQDPTSGKWVTVGDVTFSDATVTAAIVFDAGAVETIAKSELYIQGVGVTRTFRCFGDPSTADSWTYSVGYALIV